MNNRIAYIVPQYPAVSETFIDDQVNFFCDQGFDLTVFSLTVPENNQGLVSINPKIKLIYLNSSKNIFIILKKISTILFFQPKIIFKIFKQAKSFGLFIKYLFWCEPFINTSYDLVHCHFGTTATKYCLINKMLNRKPKFITTFYGYDISHIVKVKGDGVYNEVNKYSLMNFVMSTDMKNRLMKLGFDEGKIIINPPGADFKQIKDCQKNVSKDQEINILSVGRFVEKKGFDDLLKALAIVKEKTQKKFNCLIVGDGPLKTNIVGLAEKLNLNDVVRFEGFKSIKDIYNLFYQAHLFVQPSKTAKNGDME